MIFLFMLKMFLAAVLTVAGLAIGLKAMTDNTVVNPRISSVISYILGLSIVLVSGFAFVAQVL